MSSGKDLSLVNKVKVDEILESIAFAVKTVQSSPLHEFNSRPSKPSEHYCKDTKHYSICL